MKPIHLSLAGLQSYREKQEVDFSLLCDAGVFGIFGPTGSGKSTILDAMTLALYGKVERASGGTQGIMNQAENALSVSFTFALTDGKGTETYRVDRQFKRGGDVSVNNTICRLVKLGATGETVLADKANEVNARIQDILGLTMADFTRAVVLPQGKFAEFLSLKGVERRQMLQRMFRLEPYGDLLNARLAARFKETDAAVREMEAEQTGLGDASEAALEQAKLRMNETAAAALEHRTRLQEAERTAEEARRLREWADERDEVMGSLKELELRQPQMDQAKEALLRADQAARLRPYLDEWETTRAQVRERTAGLENAKREYAEAAASHEAERTEHERNSQALEDQAGPLQQRIGKLQEALELERDIGDGERQEAALRNRLDTVKSESAAHGESIKREQAMLDKAVKLQAELKDQLQKTEPGADYRLAVQNALRDKQQADTLQSQLLELEREAQASREKIGKDQTLLATLSAKRENGRYALLQLFEEAGGLALRLKRMAADSAGLLEAADQALAHARETYRFRGDEEAAARLAGMLADNEACPVCGSLHHPAPANRKEDKLTFDQDPEQAERIRRQLSEETFMLRQMTRTASGLQDALRETAGADALAEAAAAAVDDPLTAESGTGSFPTGSAELSNIEAAANGLAERKQAVASVLSRLEGEMKQLNGELQAADRMYAEADSRAQTLLALEERHAAKRKETSAELKRMVEAWQSSHPEVAMAQAEAEYRRLAQADREAEELRSRLAKSDPYLTEQQKKIEALQEQAQRLDREAVQTEAELNGHILLLEEKRRRITAQLGEDKPDVPVRMLLEETAALLERLKQSAAESRARAEQSLLALQQAGNRMAAAEQACASAAAAWERADANWRMELPKAGFSGEAEVKAAILDDERIYRIREELDAFNEQMSRRKLRLEQLQSLIGDRPVMRELWLEVEASLAMAKERQEQLLQQAAKAERDAEELEKRHERWLELERKRVEQSRIRERLARLQAVFRGNAFVEYIAEEQLMQVSRAASERLGMLTRQRYALEVDSSGGFVIRDDANGGVRRPVGTLSGGETFLTSLALALALSAQIQLNGRFPLEFFFLDEGFGTLDPDLLETVIGALERLHMERLTVGVISHVPELRARLPRKLVVTAAEPSGIGSRIRHETT